MEKIKSYQEDSEVQKNRWWILVSVAMFTFMSTLDSSIVNIALPTISKEMSVPMNQAEWVVSIYLMVVCACLLLFGKLATVLENKSLSNWHGYFYDWFVTLWL